MKSLILTVLLALTSFGATAATKYVRPDGGTATQCTGLANVPYDGVGTGEACAYNSPTWALGMYGQTSRINGGDTVIIANGTYSIGYGSGDNTGCPSDWTSNCTMLPVPSGSSGFPTRILGEGHATGCKVKPVLRGTGGSTHILSLVSSDWVDVSCLEMSDSANCIYNHPDIPCATAPPLGGYTVTGIAATDSDNVNLTDLNIHGFSNNGIDAARLSNWELLRVRIVANGFAGWDGNAGAATSSNTGYMNFKQVEIAFNGCSEAYPAMTIVQCWGETSGGYGDGIGTEATAGNWLFEDSWIHHNASDGIDMLYVKNPGGTVTVRRSRMVGNAGQQVKTNGDAVLLESNYISGYCTYFYGRFGTKMLADSCRASGNSISSTINNLTGVVLTIRYNTITGQGDNLILLRNDLNITTDNAIVNIENNVLYGHEEWGSGGWQTNAFYMFNVTPTVNWRSNSIFNVTAFCPATSTCTDPLLKGTAIATFDPRPTAGSYLRNSGNTTYPTPTKDVMGRTRPTETTPTRGAFEYVPLL